MLASGFLPQQVAITAYGNGGFRFGDMSHIGALLALPNGMHAWPVTANAAALTPADFDTVFTALPAPAVFLLGTGLAAVMVPFALRETFASRGLTFEAMSTGAAARTYNVLLAEGRALGIGLLPVP